MDNFKMPNGAGYHDYEDVRPVEDDSDWDQDNEDDCSDDEFLAMPTYATFLFVGLCVCIVMLGIYEITSHLPCINFGYCK